MQVVGGEMQVAAVPAGVINTEQHLCILACRPETSDCSKGGEG